MAAWNEQDDRPRCGQPKRDGKPCQAYADLCRHHGAKATEGSGTRRVQASDGASRPTTAANLDRAALLEAQGASTDDIAAQLGVAAGTVRDWRTRDEYREAVRQLRADMVDAVVGQTSAVASAAVQRLAAIVADPKTPPAVATRAALGVLDQLVKLRTHADLDARVAELEALLKGGAGEW
jgi:hypothetical protein